MMQHRHVQRRPIGTSVQLRFGRGRTVSGVLRNISRSGMFVATHAKPEAFTCLEVGMATPSAVGAALVWIPMFVVRRSADGIGLMMYKDVGGATATAMERLLCRDPSDHPFQGWGANRRRSAS
jgi:hypothetical protein